MARLRAEHQEDFSRGMDDSRVANRYPANASRLIQNGRVEADGSVSRRDGSRRKNADALGDGPCYFAEMFEAANGDVHEIAIFGSIAYFTDDHWETETEIATGLALGYYDHATMRVGATNYLFMANGDTTIKRWDGATWDTLPNAPSGVKFVELFNDRLAVAGHSGVLVQLSKVRDPESWTGASGALTVSILTHDGDPPSGLFTLGPHLFVFDRHATSYIDGFGEQTLVVAQGATGLSRSVGCSAFRSICEAGDDAMCWASARGIEHYQLGSRIRLLTHPIRGFWDTVDISAIENDPGLPTACYDKSRQRYHCALPVQSIRNSRTIVVDLYQRGTNWLGAPTIDQQAYTAGTELLFGDDVDGYIEEDAVGFSLRADANGYAELATAGSSGDPVVADADGYIDVDTNDTLPATLYMGPSDEGGRVVHSGGYDGFVRRHFGSDYDLDDEEADLSGGKDVTMRLVPRPFVAGSARVRKRVRAVHVSAVNDAEATLQVIVRSEGQAGTPVEVTIPASNFGQPKRGQTAMVDGVDDTPQVEIITTDRTRIALVGVTVEHLREPV